MAERLLEKARSGDKNKKRRKAATPQDGEEEGAGGDAAGVNMGNRDRRLHDVCCSCCCLCIFFWC